MAYYAIGIGGTGAKCIESLIHLCAAGLMPEPAREQAKELHVMFVDPDQGNGTLDRAQRVLQEYSTCRRVAAGGIDLFKTPVTVAVPDVWSPFAQETDPKLEDFYEHNTLESTTPNVAHLFDVLFSHQERDTPLGKGFRGHPAIGAAVLADTVDFGSVEPWMTLRSKVAQDAQSGEQAKIILFGSIFGGTGASGLPTIARLIKKELAKSKVTANYEISAVTMLPYFSFEQKNDDEMRAQAENFLINTQAALKYYARPYYLDVFDSLYVLGDHVLSPLGPSLRKLRDSGDQIDPKGGKDQLNEPHFLELYAALAAIDFFKAVSAKGVNMIARKEKGVHAWYDVPPVFRRTELLDKLDQLTRFAFAYDCTYFPTLESIATRGRPFRAPWYLNLFEGDDFVELSESLKNELLKMRDYIRDFLAWEASLQSTAKEVEMQLFNINTFAIKTTIDAKETYVLRNPDGFLVEEFANLLLPKGTQNPFALSNLWERMSDAKIDDVQARGVGRFINVLYQQCKTERYFESPTFGKEDSHAQ